MKVLFIEPPSSTSIGLLPPISLPVLKGFINTKTKHHASILDLVFHKDDWQTLILEKIKDEQPDLVGFSALSFNFQEILTIVRFIKQHFSVPIILGGVQAILSPDQCIHHHEVNFVCTGEGEFVLKELLDNRLDCTNVEGIWYKKKDKIIKNKPRRLIDNIDVLAFPDFDDFDMKKYFFIYNNHLPIMASRGCPYSCSYCNNHALRRTLKGTYVRFRSVENILQEIELRIRQDSPHGLKYLYFFDDTFILNRDFVLRFCTQFKEKGYDKLIRWNVNIHANLVTDELMKAMKGAGCYQVRMGVETGNEYIRNKVYNRGMTNKEIYHACEIIRKNKLQLRLYFMVGAPDETVEMMNESLTMAKKLHADEIFFGLLYTLPGTDIQKVCEKEHVLESRSNMRINDVDIGPVFRTKYASHAQIQSFQRQVKRWQIKEYFSDGLKFRGPLFFIDCLRFILFYKRKYSFELNQLFRWNVQRYKLNQLGK